LTGTEAQHEMLNKLENEDNKFERSVEDGNVNLHQYSAADILLK
jgi:hypothetical protein